MRIAAFTMVYNDPVFLPMWLRHYGDAFGASNLFVLDHGSDDGSTARIGEAHRVPVPRDTLDETKRAALVGAFQAFLLQSHDAVVFSDADEMLVAHPGRYAGLADFIARRCETAVRAIGFDVLQVQGRDPALDLARPVLRQRHHARLDRKYAKTLVARVPLRWGPGFHRCRPERAPDPDLTLFHLKAMDREIALASLRRARQVRFSADSLAKKHSVQFRWTDERFLKRYFVGEADVAQALVPWEAIEGGRLGDMDAAIVPIPDMFRDAIAAPGGDAPAKLPGLWQRVSRRLRPD